MTSRRGAALRRWLRSIGYQGLALSITALFLLPIAWVVAVSLQAPGAPPARGVEWLSGAPAWSNYARVFAIVPLGQYMANSLLVAGLAVPLTVVVASLAGFAMAQLSPRAQMVLVTLVVALRLVPVTALWLTRFVLFTQLQLIDTLWALIAPAWMGSSPFFVLLFYWTFRRVPTALYESARLDGLGALGTWALIAMPLVRPTIMAVSVLAFVQYWSDFINPLLYLKSEQRYTLAVGLRALQQLESINWPLLMAGVVVMVLPVLLLFFVAQRAFWAEVRMGGSLGR